MTLYSPGAIVLVRFPFTLLHTAKKRPAVVISPAQYFQRYGDLVVLALTSRTQPEPFLALRHWQPAGLLGPTLCNCGRVSLGVSDYSRWGTAAINNQS